MINALNAIRQSPLSNVANLATTAVAPAAKGTVNALDVIGSVMRSRMQDGFDGPATQPTTPAPAPAKKKKKKKGGLFSKIGGFLKKALGAVSQFANFIPGLSSITKPLQIVSGFLGG